MADSRIRCSDPAERQFAMSPEMQGCVVDFLCRITEDGACWSKAEAISEARRLLWHIAVDEQVGR